MSSPSVLDEKAGRRLKMRKIAPASGRGRSGGGAGRCPWAAVSGDRAFRPHRRHRLLHQGSRGPLRRGQPDARRSLQLRRQAGADRPQGERSVRAAARRAFRGPGSQGHRRGPVDPRPDGASSLSGRQRGLVPDLEGAAGRRPTASFEASPAFLATRRLCRGRAWSRRRFPPRSPISTTISTSRCAFPISRRAPACRRSSSTRDFGPCSASRLANIYPGCGSAGRATGSGIPTAPLSELALECGYADQAAFTRQFRKSVGLTPGAYRLATAGGRKRATV